MQERWQAPGRDGATAYTALPRAVGACDGIGVRKIGPRDGLSSIRMKDKNYGFPNGLFNIAAVVLVDGHSSTRAVGS
jgi:hypothetical protein